MPIASIGVVVGTLDSMGVAESGLKDSKADQLAAADRMKSRGRMRIHGDDE